MSSEASTPKTRTELAARLEAMAEGVQEQLPAADFDVKAAKLVFDLREAVRLLEGLDGLLDYILESAVPSANREIRLGGLGTIEGIVAQLETRAKDIREQFDQANPEPGG